MEVRELEFQYMSLGRMPILNTKGKKKNNKADYSNTHMFGLKWSNTGLKHLWLQYFIILWIVLTSKLQEWERVYPCS